MRSLVVFSVLILAVLSAGLYWGSLTLFRAQEVEKANARLTLYKSALEAELQHFAHLPFVLSLDPFVARTLSGGDVSVLDHRLARFAQSAGIDAIYLMDSTGLTIAASNAKTTGSFKGQNYSFRPYFQAALKGELGKFYGVGATTGIPGYFYAMAVRPSGADVEGVIAIKIDLSALQQSWQASGERILLSNADGIILLASNPDWRYHSLLPLTDEQQERILTSRQFGKEPLVALNWNANTDNQTALIDGEQFLYTQNGDLPNSWRLHFFASDDQAVTRASLTTGAFVVLVMLGFMAFQWSRARRIGLALRRSEGEEAQLRLANERLAVEIEERRLAEQTLQKTQAELERAGRLAALGQLASSVTHELGQPIAAMRNQLVAAEMTEGTSQLTNKMQGLVARMESITTQLRFFSRKGRDKFEEIDLVDVMTDALDLLEPSIEQTQADIEFKKPEMPLVLKANKLRIEQVMTNIVRNALDAIENGSERRIEIAMGERDAMVWFEVTDSGHGLGSKSFDDLREPFTTTRESGRGMGLGLTISAGIVSDHGGTITASNNENGGALFRVELPSSAGEVSQ